MNIKKVWITILSTMLLISGCSKKSDLDEYEHYDLDGIDTSSYYSYIDEEKNTIREYIVADISIEGLETQIMHGLFFRIKPNDYILLDKIEGCNGDRNSYASKSYTLFYDKKLYINRCSGTKVLEYTLDGEKIIKVDMASKLENPLLLTSIKDIDEKYIYYEGKENYADEYQTIRCLRKNYKCEMIEG